ncbi:hypothetical protein D1BOALGB6SA_4248 [Olavius sp. associated proteobacterium Delta 1]|nr:hypothetical protein D1BOALGB6SA_4248 [Olavius sp. associated proteobacterium Delta 1]
MSMIRSLWQNSSVFFLFVSLTFLMGCGGGGSGDSDTSSLNGTISGTATKGQVADAVMTAFSVNMDGTKGDQIGTGQTDAQGNFNLPVSEYSGPVLIEMTGGHYIDEATGQEMDVLPGTVVTCTIPFMELDSTIDGIQITPLTSMAQQMAANLSGGMTEPNISESHQAVGDFFGVNDILFTPPMDATFSGSGNGADLDMMNYGMSLAAMSQYASMQGVTNSSDFINDMMNDAADGRMDGMMGPSQIMMGGGGMMGGGISIMPSDAGTMGLAAAMTEFINSPMNQSGVTFQDMQTLINKLKGSDGTFFP